MQAVNAIRVCVWMNIPSHHQAPFFAALRGAGADVAVRYYDAGLLSVRESQGWDKPQLNDGEAFVDDVSSGLSSLTDWRERVHVVPGYGHSIPRQLALRLAQESVEWVH